MLIVGEVVGEVTRLTVLVTLSQVAALLSLYWTKYSLIVPEGLVHDNVAVPLEPVTDKAVGVPSDGSGVLPQS